jgi:hypothetical protein
MCLACDMEAMWFAMMEARAAGAMAASDAPEEPATLLLPSQPEEPGPLLPPPERGRVAGGTNQAAPIRDESEDPHPNPPPEEGGGGASAEFASNEGTSNEGVLDEDARQRSRVAPARRFACEETSAE